MRAQLYSIQESLPGQVSILARPRGGDWLFDEITALREAGVDVLVSLLTSAEASELDLSEEAACCQQQGITYFSFPILDRSIPSSSAETFTVLEQVNASLSEGKHVALHCRQGLGRAALMAASLLVLNDFSPDEAFDRLSQARGYQVPETEEQRAWVVAFAQRHHSSRSK
ncbi:MAG TPA: dual specificity protein phosphatase family protein [Ktedonobacteraceae bacterium]